MFAIIEDDHSPRSFEPAHQNIGYLCALLRLHRDRRCNRVHNQTLSERRKIDEPNTIGKILQLIRSDLNSEPGLATSAGSAKGNEPVLTDQLPNRFAIRRSANKRREL